MKMLIGKEKYTNLEQIFVNVIFGSNNVFHLFLIVPLISF